MTDLSQILVNFVLYSSKEYRLTASRLKLLRVRAGKGGTRLLGGEGVGDGRGRHLARRCYEAVLAILAVPHPHRRPRVSRALASITAVICITSACANQPLVWSCILPAFPCACLLIKGLHLTIEPRTV